MRGRGQTESEWSSGLQIDEVVKSGMRRERRECRGRRCIGLLMRREKWHQLKMALRSALTSLYSEYSHTLCQSHLWNPAAAREPCSAVENKNESPAEATPRDSGDYLGTWRGGMFLKHLHFLENVLNF